MNAITRRFFSLALLFFVLLWPLGLMAETAEHLKLPVRIDFAEVPEAQRPKELFLTFVPDGIPWMAVDIPFNAELGFSATLEVLPGTQSLQVENEQVEGLESRISGTMEEGYVLRYYPLGKAPEVAVTSPPSAAGLAAELTPATLAETRPIQDLAETQAFAAPTLSSESSGPSRQLYIVGIVVCAILIVLIVLARIFLARR